MLILIRAGLCVDIWSHLSYKLCSVWMLSCFICAGLCCCGLTCHVLWCRWWQVQCLERELASGAPHELEEVKRRNTRLEGIVTSLEAQLQDQVIPVQMSLCSLRCTFCTVVVTFFVSQPFLLLYT